MVELLSVKFNNIPEAFSKVIEVSATYSVYGAVLRLSELEVMASEHGIKESFDLTICENNKPVYHDSLTIGDETGYELISYVEERLQTLYPDKQKEIDSLVTKIHDAYMDGGEIILEGESEDTRIEKRSVKKIVTESKQKVKKESKKKKPRKNMRTSVLILGIVTLLLVGSVGSFFVFSNGSKVNQSTRLDTSKSDGKKTNESFETLLEQQKFSEAAEAYPKKISQIVDEIFEISTVEDFKELKAFNKAFPTEQGAFDSAYLSKDFEKVVSLSDVATNETRQSMLAFAYLKVGKIEEAKKLNIVLKSKGLDKMIVSTEYLKSEIDYYTDLLKQEGLTESEKTKYEAKRSLFELEMSTIGESDNE